MEEKVDPAKQIVAPSIKRAPVKAKVNSNVERLKEQGKKFGGAEGKKQEQEADANVTKDESHILTGNEQPTVVDKINVTPVTDAEFDKRRAALESIIHAKQEPKP